MNAKILEAIVLFEQTKTALKILTKPEKEVLLRRCLRGLPDGRLPSGKHMSPEEAITYLHTAVKKIEDQFQLTGVL